MRRFNQSRPGLYTRVTARRNGDKGRPKERAFRQKRERMINFEMFVDSGYQIPGKSPITNKSVNMTISLKKNATARAFRVGEVITIGLEKIGLAKVTHGPGSTIDLTITRGEKGTIAAAHDSNDLVLVDTLNALTDDNSLSNEKNERRRKEESFAIKAFGDSGQTVTSWLIDCGSSGSVSVDCETGNNAGFTDGGTVTYGNMTCTTTTDSCNQPA